MRKALSAVAAQADSAPQMRYQTPEMNDLKNFFAQFDFSPVLALPDVYDVYDFTSGYDAERLRLSAYGVGRYNERRPGMYETDIFRADPMLARKERNIHVGIDLAAPAGTSVHAFTAGRVYLSGVNPAPGDYGGTLITEHRLDDRQLWALYGHLQPSSLLAAGTLVTAGMPVARLGTREENGGWNPHLHFQLSWRQPERCDLPGVVSEDDREQALRDFPDPRLVLGPLY